MLSPHYGASKLRWCLDHIEAVGQARERHRLQAGPLASYLLHSLLTEHPHCVDPANASRTQLWDLATRDWSAQLLELFAVPGDILPRSVASRHVLGNLSFGEREIPLVVCTGDQSAMPFALGHPDINALYLNVGTGAFLQRLQAPGVDDPRLLRSVLWADDAKTIDVVEGTVNGAGSALAWLNERIAIDAHRIAGTMSRAALGQLTPPLFLNGVFGVGSPYWKPRLESQFIGEGGETARIAAVVESIAFLIAVNVEHLNRGATPLRRMLASGGLSASDYLCECVASLTELPLERTTLRESTATGLAFLIAGEPADWRPPQGVARFAPQPDAALRARFVRWRALMESTPI